MSKPLITAITAIASSSLLVCNHICDWLELVEFSRKEAEPKLHLLAVLGDAQYKSTASRVGNVSFIYFPTSPYSLLVNSSREKDENSNASIKVPFSERNAFKLIKQLIHYLAVCVTGYRCVWKLKFA